jgi:RNA polymerase sigma factor (sigma-70 family)
MNRLCGSSGAAVIVYLEQLFQNGTVTGSIEGELLERFVTRRDAAAFEAIVARHGPMVLHVCRQLLHDSNDVDDAFQATFLVLVRKAGSLKRRELLGNWLYGVAHRVAARARSLAARRAAQVAAAVTAAQCSSRASPPFDDEVRLTDSTLEHEHWLHQEIARLPEKYRIPIVLCYMEGMTHGDAARRLQWPLGTVKGRLARAKDLLRKRLTRRGFPLSEATFATALYMADGQAAVPDALIRATLRAATSISSGAGLSLAANSTISLSAAALGEGVLQAMTLTQVKTLALPLVVLGAVTTGVVVLAAQGSPMQKKGSSRAHTAASLVDRRNASQAKPALDSSPTPTTQLLRDQVNADQELYDILVAPGRIWTEDDVRRLVRWSLRLLDASRATSADHSARKAAYTAHRDRMKRLNGLLDAQSSPSGTIKAMTQAQLKEAEELLKSVPAEGNRPTLAVSAAPGQPAASGAKRAPSGPSVSPSGAAVAGNRPSSSTPLNGPTEPARGMAAMMGGAAPGEGAMAGMGGMAGLHGRMAAMSPEAYARQLRETIAGNAAELAVRNPDPRSQVIRKKLDEPVVMSFADPTPLDDILKYVKVATTSPTFAGIPIYVDPKGLAETASTMTSPVTIDLEHIPLKTTLRLALKQLGLAYCVRDGVLIISSVQGISDELAEERSEIEAAEPKDTHAPAP